MCAQSESSLGAFWIAQDAKVLHVDKEDSDQTAHPRSLIWIFVERTCQKVRFSRNGTFVSKAASGGTAKINQTVEMWRLYGDFTRSVWALRKHTFWHVRPTKTQICLRIRAVWLESSLSAWRSLCILDHPKCTQWRFWSDCTDAHAHLAIRCLHMA